MDISYYLSLIRNFIEGAISAPEFEHYYLRTFLADDRVLPQDIYEVLQKLFTDVDAYCQDASIRGPGDLDEADLLASAHSAYSALTEITKAA